MDTIDRQMRGTIESLSIIEMSEYIVENIAIDMIKKIYIIISKAQ